MKRFEFPLEKLLELRSFREKQAEIDLAKANSFRDAIQLELEDVGKKRVSAAYERQDHGEIQNLLAVERYINRLDAKKEKLLEDLAAAELAVERARNAYIVATRDRQVITKLREKKQSMWRKEVNNGEAEILDDIVNSRAKFDRS